MVHAMSAIPRKGRTDIVGRAGYAALIAGSFPKYLLKKILPARFSMLEASRRALEEAKIREERLRITLDVGRISSCDYDLAREIIVGDARFAEYYGFDVAEAARGVPGTAIFERIHPADRDEVKAVIKAAKVFGGSYEIRYRRINRDGSIRWVSARGICICDDHGSPVRLIGATVDITNRKQLEEHHQLLISELNHRGKNMLATVQAIANQTLREGTSIADARCKLGERIQAMARAQDIMLGAAGDVTIETVIKSSIAPYDTSKFSLSGKDVMISRKCGTAIAMTLHEISTNAAKYGALVAEGHVDIAWDVQQGNLELRWIETGGPVVAPPTRQGFGSRLIKSLIVGDLGGAAAVMYEPCGVAWHITIPLIEIAAAR
jgi:PAS domain S-box-containing protein